MSESEEMMRNALSTSVMAAGIILALAGLAQARNENPIFGQAVQKTNSSENKTIVGKGAYADYYGYYGNLYNSYAGQYGQYGYSYADYSSYYYAYIYANAAANNYYYAYYYQYYGY